MIWKAASFSIYFLISFLYFLGSVRMARTDSLDELKKALLSDDVEMAWSTVDQMPKELSAQQREEAIKILTSALKKEWPRCAGDIRQSIATQLAAIGAKEAVPDLLELVKQKKNIEHECAE